MNAVTVYGVVALTFMMLMYAPERRHRNFILAFAGLRAFERLRVSLRGVALRSGRGRLVLGRRASFCDHQGLIRGSGAGGGSFGHWQRAGSPFPLVHAGWLREIPRPPPR